MRTECHRVASVMTIAIFGFLILMTLNGGSPTGKAVLAHTARTPDPPASFDQATAIAKLRERIKGHEQEPASQVFKNIHTMTNTPAGRLLAIMEIGYSRSLGVNCTHCHTPEKWEAEDKPQKQIARDMSAMLTTINKDLLKNVKNLRSETPGINCTTCHRGQVVPAMDLPSPPKTE